MRAHYQLMQIHPFGQTKLKNQLSPHTVLSTRLSCIIVHSVTFTRSLRQLLSAVIIRERKENGHLDHFRVYTDAKVIVVLLRFIKVVVSMAGRKLGHFKTDFV